MIINQTRARKLTIEVNSLHSFWQKTIGLIKSDGHAVFFTTRFGVHTSLMKFPIDVFILNGHCEVVKIKINLKPNRVLFWNPMYKNVLEIRSGLIKPNAIAIKDVLEIVPTPAPEEESHNK